MTALLVVLALVAPGPAKRVAPCEGDPCRDRRHEGERWLRRYDRLSDRARRWARATANCETGGTFRRGIHSPSGTYHSYFQWSLRTWHAAGGAGDPEDRAGYQRQAVRAVRWARREGVGQWPVCGYRAAAP